MKHAEVTRIVICIQASHLPILHPHGLGVASPTLHELCRVSKCRHTSASTSEGDAEQIEQPSIVGPLEFDRDRMKQFFEGQLARNREPLALTSWSLSTVHQESFP
jgi:hypothetical protein